jgi:hypothetical protein
MEEEKYIRRNKMPFRNPFKKKSEEPKKSKIGYKILFWVIVALLLFAVLNQFGGL